MGLTFPVLDILHDFYSLMAPFAYFFFLVWVRVRVSVFLE
jgi:hypothetical protein